MAQQFKLPDGRFAQYFVHGPEGGFPLLWIHGTPGAFQLMPNILAACERKGLKVITLLRSGYGSSTRKKGRKISDIVADLEALNKHLGVQQCVVAGWSGGGPHVLACAARLPGCVMVACFAGVAPYNAEGLDFLAGQGEDNVKEYSAALQGEEALQIFCATARDEMLKADAADLLVSLSSLLPDIDKEVLSKNNELGKYVVEGCKKALEINSDGWVDDDISFIRPWGFELSEINIPVLLYQGSEDKMVPYTHGQWLSENLPQETVKMHFISGEGHISILIREFHSMIDELIKTAKVVASRYDL